MGEVQAAARHQQQVEELCVAAIRALCGRRDLHFRGGRLHRGRQRLPLWAPHLHPKLDRDDFDSFRGAADGLALRLRLSDDARHRARAPTEALRRMLFDLLEQYRVEAIAGEHWPGVRRNLLHRFERWTEGFLSAGLAETERGILLFTVAQVCRARVTQQPVLDEVADLMEATRAGVARALGPGLSQLRRTRFDQAAYGSAALLVAEAVAQLFDAAGARLDDEPDGAQRPVDERTAFGFLLDADEGLDDGGGTQVVTGRSRLIDDAQGGGYRIFTRAHDREERPAARMRADQLAEFRQALDSRIATLQPNLPKLARQLKAVLSSPARDDWASAQEEGLIDGRRLSQLVASPAERRLFRQEQREPQPDAVLCLLLDCSGSMRQHAPTLAVLMDVLARAADLAGVPFELLGFSTCAWHGGRAQRDWQRAGSPPHPGRLAETLHLVFKDADTPWRHARRDIAALLRPDLYREGVDGEALAWAAERLRRRDEPRKLLLAVSDGCPMEGATALANDPHYLDHHLQDVAAAIEQAGDIELGALGVGLDLSPYYGHCLALDLDAAALHRVFQDVVRWLARHRRR